MISVMETQVSEGIATVTLNNPPLNILTRSVLRDLRSTLGSLAEDTTLRVLTLMAAGKHFSAGADVSEHLPGQFEAMIPEFVETVQALLEFPVPVIAGVQGKCLGGGFELAQASDFLVATEGASFGQPEIVLGVIPPVACVLLPRRSAPSVAAELVMVGDTFGAREAHRVGIVHTVVPDDHLDDTVRGLATKLARHSAAALRMAKRALTVGRNNATDVALEQVSSLYINDLMGTADAVEGLQAFVDKRAPVWSHQ